MRDGGDAGCGGEAFGDDAERVGFAAPAFADDGDGVWVLAVDVDWCAECAVAGAVRAEVERLAGGVGVTADDGSGGVVGSGGAVGSGRAWHR